MFHNEITEVAEKENKYIPFMESQQTFTTVRHWASFHSQASPCAPKSVATPGGQKKTLTNLQLELQAVVSDLMQELGAKLESFTCAVQGVSAEPFLSP